jgi:uncharacterized PurR-regulated membrane protein YhhQ (DUF165 family)
MNNSLAKAEGALARAGKRILAAVLVVLRLLLPVAAILGAYAASFFFQRPITLLDPFFTSGALAPGYWLTWGHLLIMFAFFAVMLTNRWLGPPYALAQVVIGWLIVLGGWLSVREFLESMPGSLLPPSRVLWSFLVALGIAHIANIVIFDQARGKPWWRAPFYGGLGAALVLPLLYWPLAKWSEEPFLGRMVIDFAVKAAMVYVLLGLYALSRPLIRPRAGLGGY